MERIFRVSIDGEGGILTQGKGASESQQLRLLVGGVWEKGFCFSGLAEGENSVSSSTGIFVEEGTTIGEPGVVCLGRSSLLDVGRAGK